MFAFAAWLSLRLERLRHASESALTREGLVTTFPIRQRVMSWAMWRAASPCCLAGSMSIRDTCGPWPASSRTRSAHR